MFEARLCRDRGGTRGAESHVRSDQGLEPSPQIRASSQAVRVRRQIVIAASDPREGRSGYPSWAACRSRDMATRSRLGGRFRRARRTVR